MKFDEFQGVQVAAGGEVPLPQHQIVRAHGLQDALLPHQAVRAHQEAGGRAAAEQFMKSLKLAQIATHVADARTCCLHPANATHRQMNDAELEACGISPDMVRLSCGLEATDDLIADVAQALDAI